VVDSAGDAVPGDVELAALVVGCCGQAVVERSFGGSEVFFSDWVGCAVFDGGDSDGVPVGGVDEFLAGVGAGQLQDAWEAVHR